LKLTIKEILQITNGNLITGKDLSAKFHISTDTRTILNDDIFLPLVGENFDGHNFINKALERGCIAYITEKNEPPSTSADFIISVKNTIEAYLSIARFVRRKINPKVIAVTGSSGKTTVKEFIYAVLSTSFNAHKSLLNHNNEIGLCQTILSMPESTDFAVIEMGMRGLGEIELLSKYAEPDIAVITNVGRAHLGRLKSIENIAAAKCEITAHLKKSGVFLAFDDDLIKKTSNWQGKTIFYGKEYELTCCEENLTGFIYKGEEYKIPVMGEYNVINAIAAIETGKIADISYENIKKGLLNYMPVGDRGKIIKLTNGIKLIVDCYNANPDSLKASINSVMQAYKNSKVVLVLGDMAELGDQEQGLHRETGTFISQYPVYSLITVGEKAKFIAESVKDTNIKVNSFLTNTEAANFLLNNLEKDSVLFFKASRCMKFEEISNILLAKSHF